MLDSSGRRLCSHILFSTSDKVPADLAKVKEPNAVCFETAGIYGYLHQQCGRGEEKRRSFAPFQRVRRPLARGRRGFA
jgi:hypothetical protein